jgi:acyl-CoA synthetase (AMP-forming)/AMP-acid ligase II
MNRPPSGDEPVLIDENRSLTAAGLERQVELFAGTLASAGAGSAGRVAWMLGNRIEVVVLALAARRLGALLVPLSYRSSVRELGRLLQIAKPVMVVADDNTVNAIIAARAACVLNVDGPWHRGAAWWSGQGEVPSGGEHAPRLGAGASMIFTSGTTGVPKAALRTRGDTALAAAIADGLGFRPNSRYLAASPLYHSGPWTCALMALHRGGRVVLRRSFRAVDWLSAARDHAITSAFLTPTLLRRLVDAVEAGAVAPTTLRHVVVSGEPFPPELRRRATVALGSCLINCYGCTELGPLTALPAAELLTRPTSCGRPFSGVQIAAFEGDRRLPPGRTGLLRARTPLAFDGYLTPGSDTPDGSGAGWATVHDVGYVDDDEYVHLVDRANDVIISGGVNVFPADVEQVLLEHPDVRACLVFGVSDADLGELVCAAVVADRPLSLDRVRAWMRERIADDKRPRRLVVVDDLPTTATEKGSRRIARALLERVETHQPHPPAVSLS